MMTEPSQYDALNLLRSENGGYTSESLRSRKKYMSKLSKERGRHHRGAGAERNTRPMRTTRLRGARNETISSLFDDRKFEKDKALQLMCGPWSIPVV